MPIFAYFFLAVFLLSSCSLGKMPSFSTEPTNTGSVSTENWYIQPAQTKEERLEESKRRKNFRSVIRKGDYFSLKNDRETALRYYLNAHIRLKNDHVLERKIAQEYFNLKNFWNAYKYYKKVPFVDLEDDEKKQMLFSLMFDESTVIKSTELQRLGLSQDEIAYY